MPSAKLPLIVLVPGAFGTPASFEPLLPAFEKAGFATHPGPYASSNPPDPSTATCANDIDSLRDGVLLPLINEQRKDIVILAHSYGAIVASGAAKGLDKTTRDSNGQVGGVIGLIYVAGNIVLDDESLGEASGGIYPPFMKLDKVRIASNLIKGFLTEFKITAKQRLGPYRACCGSLVQRLRSSTCCRAE